MSPWLTLLALLVACPAAAVYGHRRGQQYAAVQLTRDLLRAGAAVAPRLESQSQVDALNLFLAELESSNAP